MIRPHVLPAIFALSASLLHARESFLEKFALAADRTAVLKELIPGTDDYYYYHALHYQVQGQTKELAALLTDWEAKFPDPNNRREVIKNRKILLDYTTDPDGTLTKLREKLHLTFDHQRDTEEARAELPSTLDPALISMDAFRKLAANVTLEHISDTGLYSLGDTPRQWRLTERHALLQRLKRPDYPGLVGIIDAELKDKKGGKFGAFPVHTLLTAAQLAELQKLHPDLVNNTDFTSAVLDRIRPLDTEDPDRDPAVRAVWLERLWAYASTLNPNANPLKANLLYHLLALDEKMGRLNETRLFAYLKLPRPVAWVNPRYKENRAIWKYPADLDYDPSAFTGTPPVGDDEPLLRGLILRYLIKAEKTTALEPLVSDVWLRSVLAEAKLLSGAPQPERWVSLLPPDAYKALRDRIDIDFDPASKENWQPDDKVTLDVWLKNVPSLVVRIYEINTANVHRTTGKQVNTDIDLDGLIANVERKFEYKDAPILRKKQTFSFPELNAKRGVWIIELVGGGKASRALIQKGGLRTIVRQTALGTALTVLDEKLTPVPGAFAMVGPQRFVADAQGLIALPLSTKPGEQNVIIDDGSGFTSLERIELQGEDYSLKGGFHVPRESLLSGAKAILAIRPVLLSNGRPLPLEMLEEAKVTVTSTTLDGNPAAAVFPLENLSDEKEPYVEFSVPDRLQSLTMSLNARVKSAVTGLPVEVSIKDSIQVNGVTAAGVVSDLHLSRDGGLWKLQELGLNGEPRPGREMKLSFGREEFLPVADVNVQMKTDAAGAVTLGKLDGISRLTATSADGLSRPFDLLQDRADFQDVVHIKAGERFMIPWPHDCPPAGPGEVSLLERRNESFVRQVPLPDKPLAGFLIWKDLPAGTYSLFIKGREVTLRVSAGDVADGHILTSSSTIQLSSNRPVTVSGMQEGQITLPENKGNTPALIFHIGNASTETRVHLFASRFLPAGDTMALGTAIPDEPSATNPGWMPSVYLSSRNIGDEYRYVLERRGAARFAGNMLSRPGLVINAWEIAETKTEKEVLEKGENAKGALLPAPAEPMNAPKLGGAPADPFAAPDGEPGTPPPPATPDLSFLPAPGPVLLNLKPDALGNVAVPRSALGDRSWIQILAVDQDSSALRDFFLSTPPAPPRGRRLALGLEPSQHFSQQNRVTLLEKDVPFKFNDALAAQFQPYNHLGSIHQLFTSLTGNPLLAEFSWLLEWPKLDDARRRELYSKYACHELHFFLARKDPAFFKAVVFPYLASKKDKTFMDEYLLGMDLSRYLQPWHYGRLNTLERLLLAKRIPNERPADRRLAEDWINIQPANRQRDMFLFETALKGKALTSPFRMARTGREKTKNGGDDGSRMLTALEASQFFLTSRSEGPEATMWSTPRVSMFPSLQTHEYDGFINEGDRDSHGTSLWSDIDRPEIPQGMDDFQNNARVGVDWRHRVPRFGNATAGVEYRYAIPSDAPADFADVSPNAIPDSTPLAFKLNNISIPHIQFGESDLNEVLAILQRISADNDTTETDPAKKGVKFVNKAPDGAKAVTLDLRDAKLIEVLKAVSDYAGVGFKVQPDSVAVVPHGRAFGSMTTRVFKVPPDFLTRGDLAGAESAAPQDPFASGDSSEPKLKAKPSAKEVLSSLGVTLPEGSYASFDASTGELTVKNDSTQLDLVQLITEDMSRDGKQDFVSGKTVLGRQLHGLGFETARFFRQLEKTREWTEQNYYKLRIAEQTPALVPLNRFWRDYALWDGKSPFVSTNVADAAGTFTEMVLALAVLDLPFPSEATPGKMETKDNVLTLTPSDRGILFHQEVRAAEPDNTGAKLLVSQNFYREGDRYIEEGGEKTDKFVSAEFLTGVVYGCQVVVTNPSSAAQRLDVLFQIPMGSLPVKATRRTQSLPVQIEPYRTQTLDFHFYFPEPGKFAQFPVHISRDAKTAASAAPFVFNVVAKPQINDPASWDYVSQRGSSREVLSFLEQHNLYFLNLDRMLWRMKDADFFRAAIAHLKSRHVFHPATWSYAVLHNTAPYLTEYLMSTNLPGQCGPVLESPLLTVEPVEQQTWQLLEYSPMVNARAHPLGGSRTILNDKFRAQWSSLLQILACHAKLTGEDLLAVSSYLALQDRMEEALDFFTKVDRATVAEKLQYEYLRAWLAMCQEDTATARRIAKALAAYPVDHWRKKFDALTAQLDEIEGKPGAPGDDSDRESRQDSLADREPSIDLTVQDKMVKLRYRNLTEVTVNYYPVDLEFLFSSSPFVSQNAGRFGNIRPNRSERIMLPADRDEQTIALPGNFQNANVLVEVNGGGQSKAAAVYANALDVQISEGFGQLTVSRIGDKRPLSKVYVKVFADRNGTVQFYKDGYTDLRGKFDYASLSTGDLDSARRFAILIMSDDHGAVVKEAKPPAR